MSNNVIHITDAGLQAANNAKAGGMLVKVVYFKLGDSDQEPSDTDIDIIGNTLYQAPIHFIEVLSKNSVRFTFEVPADAVPQGGLEVNEVGLFMDDNILFGRCRFDQAEIMREGNATRLHAVLTTSRCDLTTIDVTMSDQTSIPSTANVYRLPVPETSIYNVVSVLDGLPNTDGSTSPTIAYKYGNGAMEWAFSSFDRVYSGVPSEATSTELRIESLTNQMQFRNGETAIVYVIAGPARGQSRRVSYSTSGDKFVEKDGEPFSNFGIGSTVVLWRRIAGALQGSTGYPPQMDNVPPDWVITRGVGNLPVWGPPKNTGKNLNTLYQAPGRMRISTINDTGTGQKSRFSLGGVLIKDVNHIMPSLGGITQHKSSFDVESSEIEFAENVPTHTDVNLRLFTKEPGTGTYTEFNTREFQGDGQRRRFPLSATIEGPQYAFVYIRGVEQSTTSYTYDEQNNEIVFVAAPDEGLDIEITEVISRQDEGYSMSITSTTVITIGDTMFIELPVEPQSKDSTFVSVSGTHIHRKLYTLVDNKIVFSSPIKGNLEAEVVVFYNTLSDGSPQTNLSGVVTDAVLTSKALKLIRHDTYPVVLPIPAVDITAGKGIRVTGKHPTYRIESTIAESFNDETHFKVNTLRKLNDSEEITYTHRINVNRDIMLHVVIDFSAILGPGFVSPDGMEMIEYVIGFRTTRAKEPDYGREIKGTGSAGFSSLSGSSNEKAYSNASLTQVFDVIASNIPAGYIDVVGKMRVRNANISKYGSKLSMNINIIGTPVINK